MSLRVMDVQGLRLQFSQIVIRNLLRFIDSLPACYLVGGLSCLLSPKSQRLGDLAANTIVTREPKIPRPDLEQILTHKYNSLRDYPHLVARLRQRTSPREANIALQALLRRNELDPISRVELFCADCGAFQEDRLFSPGSHRRNHGGTVRPQCGGRTCTDFRDVKKTDRSARADDVRE